MLIMGQDSKEGQFPQVSITCNILLPSRIAKSQSVDMVTLQGK